MRVDCIELRKSDCKSSIGLDWEEQFERMYTGNDKISASAK